MRASALLVLAGALTAFAGGVRGVPMDAGAAAGGEGGTPLPKRNGGGCTSDLDCSLLGKCGADGACSCKPGWTGENCSAADLLPMNVSLGYQNATAASWGGRPVQMPDRSWQLMATEIAYKCPLILFEHNSQVVRAVSTTGRPEGPYEFAEVVAPPFHHNPTFVGPTPDGYYLLLFIGADNSTGVLDCRNGIPPGAHKIKVPSNRWISMAWTKDPANGPWEQRVILDTHEDLKSWHCVSNNPSAVVLPNGTVVVAYRADSCAGSNGVEALGVAVADHWSGNFTRDVDPIVTPSMAHGSNNEDPFMWTDATDGSWHIVNHQQGSHSVCGGGRATCGAHFYAENPHGPWHMSPTPVYTAHVELVNGTAAKFQTRQRPQIIFDVATGAPTLLLNAGSFEGNNGDMHILTHTYVQRFNTTAAAAGVGQPL